MLCHNVQNPTNDELQEEMEKQFHYVNLKCFGIPQYCVKIVMIKLIVKFWIQKPLIDNSLAVLPTSVPSKKPGGITVHMWWTDSCTIMMEMLKKDAPKTSTMIWEKIENKHDLFESVSFLIDYF